MIKMLHKGNARVGGLFCFESHLSDARDGVCVLVKVKSVRACVRACVRVSDEVKRESVCVCACARARGSRLGSRN